MKLVCHIGTPKTGSTYLQTTLQANADWLLERGILYPDLLSPLANHVTLFYAASLTLDPSARAYGLTSLTEVDAFRHRLCTHIQALIDTAPPHVHTMVLSSENLTGNLGYHDVLQLGEMLRPLFDEIEIVIYLRRQDEAVLSMYNEFMRRGYTNQTLDEFIEGAVQSEATPPYIQYRRVIEYWVEAFGQAAIKVHIFERARLIGGDILQDFLGHHFPHVAQDLSGLVPSAQDNSSLSAPAMEFLRRLQPYIPFYLGEGVNVMRQMLEERIDQLPGTPRPRMSQAQAQRIFERYNAGNEWVRATFFPQHEGPLFTAPTNLPPIGNVGQLSDEEFAYLSAHLLTGGNLAVPLREKGQI